MVELLLVVDFKRLVVGFVATLLEEGLRVLDLGAVDVEIVERLRAGFEVLGTGTFTVLMEGSVLLPAAFALAV